MRVILVGGDKTVYFMARHLTQEKHQVTIINRSQDQCLELARQTNATVVFGDGSNLATLEEAGARQADAVAALTPNDQDNLVCCQIARRIYEVPRTIAMVNDPENEEIFQKLGVDVAMSKTRILTAVLEQQTTFSDITELMPLAKGRIHAVDVRLDSDSPAVGKTLAELKLTNSTLIACIIRDDAVIIPHGSSRLEINDHLLVLSPTENDNYEKDLRMLTGDGV